MRTNIEIDDKLMKEALKATGAKTKREAVELYRRSGKSIVVIATEIAVAPESLQQVSPSPR